MPGDHKGGSGMEGGEWQQSHAKGTDRAENLNNTELSSENRPDTTRFSATQNQSVLHSGDAGADIRSGNPHKKLNRRHDKRHGRRNGKMPIYGALDLGTNNCRLLLARPNLRGFQIVDAFSRIIRLGEGMTSSGALSTEAMDRTIDALKICADKMNYHKVGRARLVATQACRAAHNSDEFINKVERKTGLKLEIIDQQTEASLAVSGCVTLIDEACEYVLIFDIGGGSSELIWLDITKLKSSKNGNISAEEAIVEWVSIPVGVVTMAEKFPSKHVSPDEYRAMVGYFKDMMQDFTAKIAKNTNISGSKIHFLGTSGTVTTVAGVHLGLKVYDRQKIDGLWMHVDEVTNVAKNLIDLTFEKRAAIPSIGRERADLVLGGCAILDAMLETWSTSRLRVADRGLREGILAKLMAEDGYIEPGQNWKSQPKKSRSRYPRRNR